MRVNMIPKTKDSFTCKYIERVDWVDLNVGRVEKVRHARLAGFAVRHHSQLVARTIEHHLFSIQKKKQEQEIRRLNAMFSISHSISE